MTAQDIGATHPWASTAPPGRESRVAGAPWLPRSYLPRPRLWGRLDSATAHPVTQVVAPAGAGKTLGVAGWLHQAAAGATAVWLRADSSVSPEALDRARDRAGFDSYGRPGLLVVDDAHRLPAAVVQHLDSLLTHDPEALHLLLLTRWDLALSRLVPELLGHLTVVRGDVLRLSDDESAQLVAEHTRTPSPELNKAITLRADGWCAAVVLAARAGAAAPDQRDFARRLQAAQHATVDLVAGEVFAALRSRERHLLICVATEPVLTAEVARHVTHDPSAGETLAGLESTGLLVDRVTGDEGAPESEDRFHLHPLLLEVVRRRALAGGVDVQRAHATVRRAARIDVGRGEIAAGLRRLLSLGGHEESALVLVEHGPRVVAEAGTAIVRDFLRRAGSVVERHPRLWPLLAWACWLDGDDGNAAHWSQRVQEHAATRPGSISESAVLTVRLQRSRRGLEPVAPAVEDARPRVDPPDRLSNRDPYEPLLLMELGAAENWTGDLESAELHLSHSVMLSRIQGLGPVTAEALTHLALTQFMAGREAVSLAVAGQALETSRASASPLTPATRARVEVVVGLAGLYSSASPAVPTETSGCLPDDLAGRLWRRVLDSELSIAVGDLAEAQRRLETPLEAPGVPPHLRIVLLMHRAALALITGHRSGLGDAAVQLARHGAVAEERWTRGVLAELENDLPAACEHYLAAVAAVAQPQPATRALVTVCAAQLLDHLGETTRAEDLLAQVLSATEAQRCVAPFLGWSPHGTPVGTLLARHPAGADSPWGRELRDTCADLPGVVTVFRPVVASAREVDLTASPTVLPVLSPREREVLGELARGATYADIAGNLFVSENTVKTHVSSLYAKLAVGRRSEALAVARTLHLL